MCWTKTNLKSAHETSLVPRQSCLPKPNLFNLKMNLLPNEEFEFAKADYWDKFFKERGSKNFEWYGEYNELCGELHKYVKEKDSILVIGCGNSRLSSDLYDVGFRKMTNIDISSVVIKQMKAKEGKSRPEMVFQQMDALNMGFDAETFTVVLDKGTLDALMPLDAKDDHMRAEKLFHEVNKVLKIGGRYIIISLLQPHILTRILNNFTEMGWMIRIIRCVPVEKKNIAETGEPGMPVFMIICTKLKRVGNADSILEADIYVNDKIQRIKSAEEISSMVDGVQKAMIHFKTNKDDMEIEFCLKGQKKARYLIHFVNISRDQKELKKYGAFIVQQGRENEWMFGTNEGRKYLLNEIGFHRLAIIALCRDNFYENKETIQEELNRTILEFAPCFMECEAKEIPYLTLGHSLGMRETIYRTVSELSGEIVVEEAEISDDRFRRLIFMNNQAAIQSEVRLQKDPKKKEWRIDINPTISNHTSYMSVGVSLVKEPKSVLVIGLGGGGLCMILNKFHENLKVIGVEIDPVIVKIARDYFGLKENKYLKIVNEDGLEVIKKKERHDVIMFDVDSKEQGSVMSAPPAQFLDPSVLECVKQSIGTSGVFVLNVVSRIKNVHEELTKKLKQYFSLVAWYNMKEDVNRIIFLSNRDLSEIEWKDSIIKAAENLNKNAKGKLKSDSILDLLHFETELII